MPNVSTGRRIVGFAAIALIVIIGLALPRWGLVRQRAVVEAARTFRLYNIGPGRYEWSLKTGRTARGQGIIKQRALRFERSDLVELEVKEDLRTGEHIEAGQALASLHSPRNERRLAELEAEREALRARRALLTAGSRVEEVEKARTELELAIARRAGELPRLERARNLAHTGAVSEAELETEELRDRIRQLEIDLARATVDVARSPARPEALAELDAELAAVDVRIEELRALLSGDLVQSPISGILEMGGNNVVLRVYDLDRVYLRIPIPEEDRLRVEVGDPVEFVTPSSPHELWSASIVELGEDASALNGRQVFWASAEVDNPEHRLRSGMTGTCRLRLGSSRGWLGSLWYELVGY